MKLSIIIPVLNEERNLELQREHLRLFQEQAEILVVDGGSSDSSAEVAGAFATVLSAPRGRALQMNAGARAARGDTFLFLHADVFLPPDALSEIAKTISRPGIVAGAFRTRTVAPEPSRYAFLLPIADIRSHYTGLPYGDQALFLRRDTFVALGGFPELSLMEDLELARRLRRRGRIETVKSNVTVSGRRFIARPFFYFAVMNIYPILYRLGVPTRILAHWYASIR